MNAGYKHAAPLALGDPPSAGYFQSGTACFDLLAEIVRRIQQGLSHA
jgi:hypothetical protein